MTHNPSITTIYYTSEYARFKMLEGNRQLNELKIKKIIREITHGNNMLQYYPIQVREVADRLEILDGQHRFYICKKLKCPVHYILVKEQKSMSDIARINSNVEKWKGEDYINCYAQQNNEHYTALRNFIDVYGVNLSVALKLLYYGNPGTEGTSDHVADKFRNGLFVVNHLQPATELLEKCNLFLGFPGKNSRSFIIAIYRIEKAGKIPIAELAAAYTKRPEMLTQQSNYKEYIIKLEQIINVKKQTRLIIT